MSQTGVGKTESYFYHFWKLPSPRSVCWKSQWWGCSDSSPTDYILICACCVEKPRDSLRRLSHKGTDIINEGSFLLTSQGSHLLIPTSQSQNFSRLIFTETWILCWPRELGIPCNFSLFSQIRYKRKYESVHAVGESQAGQTGVLVVKHCELRPHSSQKHTSGLRELSRKETYK